MILSLFCHTYFDIYIYRIKKVGEDMTIQSIIQVNIELMLIVLCVFIWILTSVWTKDNRHTFRHIWIIDLLTVGMLITDVLAIVYRGNVSIQGYYIVRIANFLCFIFMYSMTLYLSFFIEILFEHPQQGRKRILAGKILSATTIVLIFINQLVPFVYDFDAQNRYFRKGGWYLNALCQLMAILVLASVIYELRREVESSVFFMLFIDILMPMIATAVQLFIYGISIVTISIGVTQLLLFMIMFHYQEQKLKESDVQLAEYNAKLMLTQVQPHFMLNTLSTIQYLCKSDSDAAFNTISDFSIYLRNNMEFAASNELISFEKELSHIEKYVSIEQKRFGERIKVVYDIKEKDFELPALSVQPLVENAIKHGISKKRAGGTVELFTWRGVDKIHIVVKDDGVGYDVNKPFSEDRVHLGLQIVKDRLQRKCSGDVRITSIVGKGTICEITIPIEFS